MSYQERPILFPGSMVRAILTGSKTQTRIVIDRVNHLGPVSEVGASTTPGYDLCMRDRQMQWNDLRLPDLLHRCPYGQPGDRLWVRETWRLWEGPVFSSSGEILDSDVLTGKLSRFDLEWLQNRPRDYRADSGDEGPWRPSVHMPRWASRILLEVTEVRVQQLQDITEEDAKAEGISFLPLHDFNNTKAWWQSDLGKHRSNTPIGSFSQLWDSSSKPGQKWNDNPWVWIITFRRLS